MISEHPGQERWSNRQADPAAFQTEQHLQNRSQFVERDNSRVLANFIVYTQIKPHLQIFWFTYHSGKIRYEINLGNDDA
jgi:hypothetical protein